MYPLQKGKIAKQAHVGLPKGTFEEEHGRKGFSGKSAHLYHANPPTGWIGFAGKLRPHCIDCNKLTPTDLKDPKGSPVAFIGNKDVVLSVSLQKPADAVLLPERRRCPSQPSSGRAYFLRTLYQVRYLHTYGKRIS